MKVHPNSLAAHKENLKLNKYPNQIRMIVKAYQTIGEGTMHNVAKYCRVPLNTISGRFKRMREDGIIEPVRTTSDRKTIYRLKIDLQDQ